MHERFYGGKNVVAAMNAGRTEWIRLVGYDPWIIYEYATASQPSDWLIKAWNKG